MLTRPQITVLFMLPLYVFTVLSAACGSQINQREITNTE